MIRIITATEANSTTITVDGQVIGEYLDTIDNIVQQAKRQRSEVHLWLRDVSRIDTAGLAFLRRLALKGVHLSAAGVHTPYIIAEVRQPAAHDSAVQDGADCA